MANVSVTITLPEAVYEVWQQDENRRGVIAKLVSEHYGFVVNKSRVVKKGEQRLVAVADCGW